MVSPLWKGHVLWLRPFFYAFVSRFFFFRKHVVFFFYRLTILTHYCFYENIGYFLFLRLQKNTEIIYRLYVNSYKGKMPFQYYIWRTQIWMQLETLQERIFELPGDVWTNLEVYLILIRLLMSILLSNRHQSLSFRAFWMITRNEQFTCVWWTLSSYCSWTH